MYLVMVCGNVEKVCKTRQQADSHANYLMATYRLRPGEVTVEAAQEA